MKSMTFMADARDVNRIPRDVEAKKTKRPDEIVGIRLAERGLAVRSRPEQG
jgi:hypothetical protein